MISQNGPRRIWDTVEVAYRLWQELGHPAITRFGVTALNDAGSQHIWLDRADSSHCWPLPL